jgi:hypothetical protein
MRTRSPVVLWLASLVVLLLSVEAYWPGLHGAFLFDDFGNLPALGSSGPVDNWPRFWSYVTSGTADPTGRPLTLLSFLLDSNNWPADPFPFKRTNLILHLCNGLLLAMLLQRLGLVVFSHAERRRINMAALLGAAFWLLHPLFVSTTLYIVQREAMLPGTFTLVGLMLWLHGRSLMQQGALRRGLFWMAMGLGSCTILGVLSKANGILLPCLALVIEYALLRPSTDWPNPSRLGLPLLTLRDKSLSPSRMRVERSWLTYRRALLVCGWFPAMLVSGYLLNSAWKGFTNGVASVRPWTMGQRLLTEPRILMRYLDLLWLPRPFTPGLFNDEIKASLSLWSPITTLPSIVTILAIIVIALRTRKRVPALAAATLFYFVGQSIESSTIPLELYFEHRNYLPAMLMFWPLALWICGVRRRSYAQVLIQESMPSSVPRTTSFYLPSIDALRAAFAVLLVVTIAIMTYANAQLWGDTHDQSELWAAINPHSPRAQVNAATLEIAAGRPAAAVMRTLPLLQAHPDEVQLAFTLVSARCALGTLSSKDLDEARRAMSTTRDPGSLFVTWFEASIPIAESGQCRNLDLSALDDLIDAGLTNPKLMGTGGRRQDLLHLKGQIALLHPDPDAALRYFNASLDQDVRPGAALEQAAVLGSAGYPNEGLAHLAHYSAVAQREPLPAAGMPRIHAWILQRQHYWPKEIAYLRDTLEQDAKTKAAIDK